MRPALYQTDHERLHHIHDALDWLEANPDKHIKNRLALSARGGPEVSPIDPSATCFCALGRIAKESGVQDISYAGIEMFLTEYLYPFKVTKRMVFDRNDFAAASRAGMKAGLDQIRSIFPPRPERIST